jgi:GrpB-like predicted nucleotidyltransferase (UPF0157 family)
MRRMQWQALPAIFLGLLPFLSLPTIIAFMGRKRSRFVILGFNVLLLVLDVGGIVATGAPIPGALGSAIAWVCLLGFSLKRDAAAPGALDEPVTLAAYDAHWPAAFEAERSRLCRALEISPESIEHIGSTAVPGLLSKPVVDLMLGVPRYPPIESAVSRLVILGYQDIGEAGVAGRRYLRMRETTSFNVHVVERGGEHWTNNLRLRDYLRRDADARARYAGAKRAALASGDHLLAYSAAKQPTIVQLMAASRLA